MVDSNGDTIHIGDKIQDAKGNIGELVAVFGVPLVKIEGGESTIFTEPSKIISNQVTKVG